MSGIPPNIQPPTIAEIHETAAAHHIDLSDAEAADFQAAISETLEGYERLDELSPSRPEVEYTDEIRATGPTRTRTR